MKGKKRKYGSYVCIVHRMQFNGTNMYIRPCSATKREILDAISGKTKRWIQMEGSIFSNDIKENESLEEFIIKADLKNLHPDLVFYEDEEYNTEKIVDTDGMKLVWDFDGKDLLDKQEQPKKKRKHAEAAI